VLIDTPRRAAILRNALQNAASSETLVACPAIRTECLTIAGIFIAERRWHDAKVFQARTGPPAGKPTRGLNWPGQSARLAPEQGKRRRFTLAASARNYPIAGCGR
jgi:hypothetical protein